MISKKRGGGGLESVTNTVTDIMRVFIIDTWQNNE